MKTLKSFFGLFVVVAIFYVAWKMVPPYLNDYQFQDSVVEIAKEVTFNYQKPTDDVIRERVAKKAAEFDIPILPDQVHITYNGNECIITGDYTVHVELPGKPMNIAFHVNSKKI